MALTHISLFSGIGCESIAAGWAGFHTVLHCEIDTDCQKVLRKYWPNVPIIEDVRNVTVDSLVNLWYNSLSIEAKGDVDMVVKDSRYDEAVNLYQKGLSIQNIADFYGITRQAMWMILKRRGCVFRDHLKYNEENHFYRGGSIANGRVHDITERAIENKILIRPTVCSQCGKTGAIEAHHPDYNKPLEVTWLCQPCHHEWHKNNRAVKLTITLPPPMSHKEIAAMGGRNSHKAQKEVSNEEPFAEPVKIDLLTAGVP